MVCFYDPANPHNKYWTSSISDPGIPSGYVNSLGSDGAQPAALKQYTAGINSGGFPAYVGDPSQEAVNPSHPNGILN